MTAPIRIDSNKTGLSIAEETSPKVLPGSPVWYAYEPNSYSDLGGQISTVAREPINAARQRQKGTVTSLDASGGFNTDVTQNNLTRLMQGFMFADAHEKVDTASLLTAGVTITSVDGTAEKYMAASGLSTFVANNIILASGFTNSANNGISVVSASAAGYVTSGANLVDEAAPPAAARVQVVGHQFASADATLNLTGAVLSLLTTTKDLTTLGLNIGEWVWIGGDAAGTKFATAGSGYARILSIAAHAIVFDKVTNSAFATDAGTGKTIQIFYGKYLRNESDTSLIKTRTYNIERSLGNDGVGVQGEYLEGAVANEFTLNVPSSDKLNADLTFIAMDNTHKTGTVGLKAGTRVPVLGENAFNTSSNVYRIRMNIIDPTTLLPTALFGYVTEANIAIKNNAAIAKAVGSLGGIDISVGNFEVSGKVTAYFSSVTAVDAVRNNSDVTVDIIMAARNAGLVYDLPLVGLGDGRLSVTKDQSITVPLDTLAAAGATGYTLGITAFPYLPNAAMPA